MKSAFGLAKAITIFLVAFFLVAVGFMYFKLRNENTTQKKISLLEATPASGNSSFALPDDVTIQGNLNVQGKTAFSDDITIEQLATSEKNKVLSVNNSGKLILVDDVNSSDTYITNNNSDFLPKSAIGGMVFSDGVDWKVSDLIYHSDIYLGLNTKNPEGTFHINTGHSDTTGLIVQGVENQSDNLQEWWNDQGNTLARVTAAGGIVLDNSASHLLEVRPSGDTGYLSSSGGAIFVENTYNIGTGIGIYSNAGSDALGNMINVKVDNALYNQAAFYMNYDGISNAVEIVSNTNDSSSNALSVTNFNTQDSAVGVIGYETGRGTIKVTHNGTGSDANASGISIDLQGTGTKAQGLYIDSTASGGTTGNLLRLRNQTTDRFVVDYLGGVKIGGNGTNTSVTKYGNTVGDEFFIGTNGAFRVQRSATDSEAFRTQVLGDTQGRWLGTADGKLKFGDGSSAQDVVMQRTGVGLMQLDADYEIVSQDVNNDVLTLTASDGSRLGRFTETSGGHGWFEIDNSSGNAVILFRADGGNSYINSGNFGLGTTSAGTSANKVLAIGNGTAPTTSIADGIQLWAEDVASSSELRVRDEAGNISTLSPHNFSLIPGGASEDMAWSFYSENGQYAINADITKALRLVEGISGQQLVYIKDLDSGNVVDQTARTYASNFKQVESQDLNKQLTAKLGDYVTKQELASNFDFAEKVINVLKEIAIKTKAIFEGSVEFLASAVFHGPITVNADTSGIVYVPAYTKVYKLTFENSFSQKPIVYVTAEDSALNFNVIEVTQSGFEVQINNPSENAMQFQWLALMSENNNPNIEVLEKINSAAIVEPVEFLEPIIVQTPLPSMVPDSATDSSELSN